MYKKLLAAVTTIPIFLAACANDMHRETKIAKKPEPLQVNTADIADLNPDTGVGCIVEVDEKIDSNIYIRCASRDSHNAAWNAAMFRANQRCGTGPITIKMSRPPVIPEENGLFGAQMDIKCAKS